VPGCIISPPAGSHHPLLFHNTAQSRTANG
jgi:hypothetical protein